MSDKIRQLATGCNVPEKTPAVSIIIPNYNTARYIADTLDSVLAQTFTDYEVIVINDASPDTEELKSILEKYRDSIVFIDKIENSGTSDTRNLAAEHARGKILAFLDADDIWKPTFLAEVIEFKGSGDYDMAYADAETFGAFHALGSNFLKSNPAQGEITRELLIAGRCHILPSGTLIDAAAFRTAGGFDPLVLRTEDFDLWMRFIFAGVRIGYKKKLLFKFRLSPGSGSGDSIQRIMRCRDVWRILQTKLPFTDEENSQIELNIALEEAALVRAEGRLAVFHQDWPTARRKFHAALSLARQLSLPLIHRIKMLGIWLTLHIWPSLVYKVLLKTRPDEIYYMQK